MNNNANLADCLKEFIENEGKSCSFDPELITPEYVYRMWGGTVPLNEIEEAMRLMAFSPDGVSTACISL